MKIAKFRRIGFVVGAFAIAGFAGVLPIDIVIPLLLFGSLVRGSFFLIEKAIVGTAQAKDVGAD